MSRRKVSRLVLVGRAGTETESRAFVEELEFNLMQQGRLPVYEEWLPYADKETFDWLHRLTALEHRIFFVFDPSSATGDSFLNVSSQQEVSVSERIVHLECLVQLYHALLSDSTVRCRYTTQAMWNLDGKCVSCIVYPIVVALREVLRALLASMYQYDTDSESDKNEDVSALPAREFTQTEMSRLLALSCIVRSIVTNNVKDRVLLGVAGPVMQEVIDCLPWLRAYMFYNCGRLFDVFHNDRMRELYSMIHEEKPTSKDVEYAERSLQMYKAAANILRKQAKTLKLGHRFGNISNPWASRGYPFRAQEGKAVTSEMIDEILVARKARANDKRSGKLLHQWPVSLLTHLVHTLGILYWINNDSANAVAVARCALFNAIPIVQSDGWEIYHMQEARSPVTPPEECRDSLFEDPTKSHETLFVSGMRELPQHIEIEAGKLHFRVVFKEASESVPS